jgi:2-dehydropantoate 2-reductase
MNMKICVIGSGAMGSVYGGLLCKAGYDVTLVDLRADHVEAIRGHGLRVDGVCGEHVVRPPVFVDHAGLRSFDAAIVFVDANSTRQAARIAEQVLAPDGFAMTLQNGIGNVEALSERLGEARVLAGVSMDSANYRAPGHASYTNQGPIYLGELHGKTTPRLEAMAAALVKAGFKAHLTDRARDYIWEKFTLNCAVNPIAALTGLRGGEFIRIEEISALQDRVLDEAFAVAAAKGIRYPNAKLRESIKELCYRRYNQPSMLQHVTQGRRTEIDALNGALVREAKLYSIPTPYNETIVALIKGLQKHREQAVHQPPIDYQKLEAEAAAAAPAGAR